MDGGLLSTISNGPVNQLCDSRCLMFGRVARGDGVTSKGSNDKPPSMDAPFLSNSIDKGEKG